LVLLPKATAAVAVFGVNDDTDEEGASAGPGHDGGEDVALPGGTDRGHGVVAAASMGAPKP
jgi:hypothetical protein